MPRRQYGFASCDFKFLGGKRGMGAVVCNCPQPGMWRENVLQLPVWYI